MVRFSATPGDEFSRGSAVQPNIQEAVSVQMRDFAPARAIGAATKPVSAEGAPALFDDQFFQSLHCGSTARVEYGGRGEERGIERDGCCLVCGRPNGGAGRSTRKPYAPSSARRFTCRMTRRCTALNTCCVHSSKYQAGRTCSEYHVVPIKVVVPSPLLRRRNCPRWASM